MSVEIPETPAFPLSELDLSAAVRPGTSYDGAKPFPVILKALFAFLAAERTTLAETRDEVLALGQSFEDLVGDFAARLAERALQSDLMSLASSVEGKANETDLLALEGRITNLTQQLTTATSRVTSLEATTTTLTQQLAAATTRITALEASVAQLIAGGTGGGTTTPPVLTVVDAGAAATATFTDTFDGGTASSAPTATYDGGLAA